MQHSTLRREVHALEEGYSIEACGKFIFFRRAWKRGSEHEGVVVRLRGQVSVSSWDG